MADMFSKNKRSEIMSKIRSKNTRAEVSVFKELKRRKIYFQKHYNKAVGKPDIALPRKKKAVFIDGDFWHGYKLDESRLPKAYWRDKIKGNINRDKRIRKSLKDSGWQVLRIWEHQVFNDFDHVIEKIVDFLKS